MNQMAKHRGEFSFLRKLGFGTGGLASGMLGDFMFVYFLFFLTDIVGIRPVYAGTIMMVGTIWQAVLNLSVGVYSDRNFKGKNGESIGRKRPFLIRTVIPLGIFFGLLFTTVNFANEIYTAAWYIAVVIFYYLAYVCYEVPYYALAANLSNDSDERTSIRTVATTIEYLGSFLLGVIPPTLVDFLLKSGLTDQRSWQVTAVVFSVICMVGIFVCWYSTKGKELESTEEETLKLKDILALIRLKPYMILIAATFIYFIYYTMTSNVLYIFMYDNLALSGPAISFVYGLASLAGMAAVTIAGKIAGIIDKKKVFIVALLFTGCGYLAFNLIGIFSINSVILFVLLDVINGGAYWTIIFALMYDVVDLDEFKTGQRREGAVIGFYSFMTMVAAGLTSQASGLLMEAGGYSPEAEVQTAGAYAAIFDMVTLYPGLCLIGAALIVMLFPITAKRAAALTSNLEKKRNGEPYSTEGFEKLL